MRRPLVAGNWKMNGSLASVRELTTAIGQQSATVESVDLAVFPPFVYLAEVARLLDSTAVGWGGQTLSEHDSGAYTGEVAPAMLTDYGCRYVLVGHSERRTLYGETSAAVADKFVAAQRHDLIPVLCVGETLDQREQGTTETVIAEQLDAVIDAVGIDALTSAVIAYEPVWAIGTGKTASPEQAQDVHAFIRGKLADLNPSVAEAIKILYGGSVKGDNAAQLFAKPDIDGGLIGGASLKADEFLRIAAAAAN